MGWVGLVFVDGAVGGGWKSGFLFFFFILLCLFIFFILSLFVPSVKVRLLL